MNNPHSPSNAAVLIEQLRSLVNQTTSMISKADEDLSSITSEADEKRSRETTTLEERMSEARKAESTRHEAAMASLKQEEQERIVHARQQYEGRKKEIDEEADQMHSSAHKNLKEQEWLAESVFEATGSEPRKRLELTRRELKKYMERLEQFEESEVAFRTRCKMTCIDTPLQPSIPETSSDLEEALASIGSQADVCQDALRSIFRLAAPRCFIGPVPLLLVLLGEVIAWGGLTTYFMMSQKQEFPDAAVSSLWWSLLGPAAVLLVILLVKQIAIRQYRSRSRILAEEIARARAMSDDLDRVGEEQCSMEEEAHRKKLDREINEARETIAPKLEQITPRRERRLEKLEENYKELLAKIDERHREKIEEETGQHDGIVGGLDTEETETLRAIETQWSESTDAARASHASIEEELMSRWKDGTTYFHEAMEAIGLMSRECIPDWDDSYWSDFEGRDGFNGLIQYGSYDVEMGTLDEAGMPPPDRFPWPMDERFTMPAMLHLPHAGSLYLDFAEHGREQAVHVLQASMLRLLASMPPGKIRFTVIDPVGLGQNFAGFMHLADHEEGRILEKIWTEPRHIEQQLMDLSEHMETVIQTYLRNEYETIDEYNIAAGEIAEPYRYLVIADLPVNLSENAGKRLSSIMQTGARCGVYTLVACDTRQNMPRDVLREDLVEHSDVIQVGKDTCKAENAALQPFPLTLDTPPDDELLTRIVKAAGDAAEQSRRVEVPFNMIAPAAEDCWTGSTSKEIRVPLGQTGATRHQNLLLGRGTSQHALVAGKTGSGKSTLLHVLITNLALWYSPDEIEFHLVDFKKGVEFKTYAEHGLPHARVIAIESDREFGLSVLQRIDLELKERGERFRDLGVQDLASFRNNTGEALPRVLLVVDEFQELFVDDDKLSQDAALLLDRIVRQGRAFGIHALLGSQTLDGSYSLARSTLGQMGVRIALQCTEADSYLILSEENAAARLLERPGEAIYNDAGGKVEGNNSFQVCWLDDSVRDHYLDVVRSLAEERNTSVPSAFVFEGNIPADLTECRLLDDAIASHPSTTPASINCWTGDAIAIKDPTAFRLQLQSGSNLMVVGQREESATALFMASMLSSAAQCPAGDSHGLQFFILDGLASDSDLHGQLENLGSSLPHACTAGSHRESAAIMNELGAVLEQRRTTGETSGTRIIVILHGLHRLRELRRPEDDFSFSMRDENEPASPHAILSELLKDGPALGIHVLTWVDTLNNLNRTLDRGSQREFEMRILYQMSANDSSQLIDSPVASGLGLQRTLFCSEDTGIEEKYRPWAMPDEDWLKRVVERLRTRP